MGSGESNSRLTEIATVWDQIQLAQTGNGPVAQNAREAIFQRYAGAVRRYVLAALGDPAAAEDLTQEFGLALVQKKFRLADPKQGRFRHYIKGVLFHLVRQHLRKQKKQYAVLPPDLDQRADARGNESDRQFNQSWRDELLARTWGALADAQPSFFTVLHFRAVHPDMPADQMAVQVAPQLGKPVSSENLRQMLHRARKVFADLLLREVTQSLKNPTADAVQQELTELELAPFFQNRDAKEK
jgi:RNA polymerase sigma factor (sigma-70 family)